MLTDVTKTEEIISQQIILDRFYKCKTERQREGFCSWFFDMYSQWKIQRPKGQELKVFYNIFLPLFSEHIKHNDKHHESYFKLLNPVIDKAINDFVNSCHESTQALFIDRCDVENYAYEIVLPAIKHCNYDNTNAMRIIDYIYRCLMANLNKIYADVMSIMPEVKHTKLSFKQKVQLAKDFYKVNEQLPEAGTIVKGIDLGRWLAATTQGYQTEDPSHKLSEGSKNEFRPLYQIIMKNRDITDNKKRKEWEREYQIVLKYSNKYQAIPGRFSMITDENGNDVGKIFWTMKQRVGVSPEYKSLYEQKIGVLRQFTAGKDDWFKNIWYSNFQNFKLFVNENKRLPGIYEKFQSKNGEACDEEEVFEIGVWWYNQIRAHNGKRTESNLEWLDEKLSLLKPYFDMRSQPNYKKQKEDAAWKTWLHLLEENWDYFGIEGKTGEVKKIFEWFHRQFKLYKKGKLPEDRLDLLDPYLKKAEDWWGEQNDAEEERES